MHRGRVKSFPPFFSPSPPCPLAYWSISPSISKINCATCKKKLISNGFFKNKCLVVVGCCLFFCTMISNLPPIHFCHLVFLSKTWSLSFYSARFTILFGMNLCNIHMWEGWGQGGGVRKGGLTVVLTCCHGSYCTVSLFNKDVKSVCRATSNMINQHHTITKLSKIQCRDHTLSHYGIYFYLDYFTSSSHAFALMDTGITTSIKTLLMLLYYM